MSASFRIDGDIAVITMHNPPVNALGQSLRQGLVEALAELDASEAKGAVLIGEGRCFSAGADITEFGKPPQAPGLTESLENMEASAKPIVAAIHGTALGGGLELALCCHYRVADSGARLGLPEVKIGLIPGAGGTQRLPRLTGAEVAIEMITTGRMVPAAEAKEFGIVSAVYDSDLQANAIAFLNDRLTSGEPHPAVRDLSIPQAPDADFFVQARATVEKKARGQTSPLRCIDAVQAACENDIDAGLAKEREIFSDCMDSDQREGLIHYFFAEREAAKIPGLSPDAEARPIKSAGVIGSGTMGGGISMCFANAGIPVTVVDLDEAALGTRHGHHQEKL